MQAVNIQRRLRSVPHGSGPETDRSTEVGTVFVVESEVNTEASVGRILELAGLKTAYFNRGCDFLDAVGEGDRGCVLLNLRLSDADCVVVLEQLERRGIVMPVVLYGAGSGRLSIVQSFPAPRSGTGVNSSFGLRLVEQIMRALEAADRARATRQCCDASRKRLARLTTRQLQVSQQVIAGISNKAIAGQLGISERTVEIHRARAMRESECDSAAELVWLFCKAGFDEGVTTWPIDELRRQLDGKGWSRA